MVRFLPETSQDLRKKDQGRLLSLPFRDSIHGLPLNANTMINCEEQKEGEPGYEIWNILRLLGAAMGRRLS